MRVFVGRLDGLSNLSVPPNHRQMKNNIFLLAVGKFDDKTEGVESLQNDRVMGILKPLKIEFHLEEN